MWIKMIKSFFMTVEYYYRDSLVSTGLIKIKKKHILGDVGLQYFFENVPIPIVIVLYS